jgi:exodeoxyribonuclease V alpha subunit
VRRPPSAAPQRAAGVRRSATVRAWSAVRVGRPTGRLQAALVAERAIQRAEASGAVLAEAADRIREYLLAAWDGERGAARAAARVVLDGPSWWGLKRAAVALAGEQLAGWADRWRPHLPDLPTDPHQIARVADRFDDRPALWTAFDTTAHRAAEREHPDHAQLHAAAEAARRAVEQARRALADAHRRHDERLAPLGPIAWTPDPQGRLADLERDLAATRHELAAAQARIAGLAAEPALLTQPPARLDDERERWRARHDVERTARRAAAAPASSPRPARSVRQPEPSIRLAPRRADSGIGR